MSLWDWMSRRCFEFVHGNNLVYNACWEDPRLDHVALELGPNDVVMMITSAGCNALDYALAAPKRIHAVDMNHRQNALLELKIAGIRALDFETFFSLFGKGRLEGVHEVYARQLRGELSPLARGYWDRKIGYFAGKGWRDSFYFRGTSGLFARSVNFYIDRVAKVRDDVEKILNADSVEEQREIFDGGLRDDFWNRFLRWTVGRDTTLSLLGVPKPQRQQVDRHYDGGIVAFIEDAIEAVFASLPLADNYFWRVYLTGQYTSTCCPEYLTREGFEKLKGGLVDRISVHTSTLLDFMRTQEEPITRFVLLDHMDWLHTHLKAVLEAEWGEIARRAGPNARLIWRSGGLKVDFIDPIMVERNGRAAPVGELLSYNKELADRLHQSDRVHTYGSFHIADFVA